MGQIRRAVPGPPALSWRRRPWSLLCCSICRRVPQCLALFLCSTSAPSTSTHLDVLQEGTGAGEAALDVEGDHAAEAAHLLGRHRVLRVRGQARVQHLLHGGVRLQHAAGQGRAWNGRAGQGMEGRAGRVVGAKQESGQCGWSKSKSEVRAVEAAHSGAGQLPSILVNTALPSPYKKTCGEG